MRRTTSTRRATLYFRISKDWDPYVGSYYKEGLAGNETLDDLLCILPPRPLYISDSIWIQHSDKTLTCIKGNHNEIEDFAAIKLSATKWKN